MPNVPERSEVQCSFTMPDDPDRTLSEDIPPDKSLGRGPGLSASLRSELLGIFSPGIRTAVHQYRSEAELRLVHIHEDVHSRITRGASLGAVAVLAGAYSRKGSDASARARAYMFVDAFCRASLWIQEGCTTFAENFYTEHLKIEGALLPTWTSIESTRPNIYILSYRDYMSFVPRLAHAIRDVVRFQDGTLKVAFLNPLVAECVARASMSPAIGSCLMREILELETNSGGRYLREIWKRFSRIRAIDPDQFASVLARWLSAFGDTTEYSADQINSAIDGAICETACISYENGSIQLELSRSQIPDLPTWVHIEYRKNISEFLSTSDLSPHYPLSVSECTASFLEKLYSDSLPALAFLEIMPYSEAGNEGLVMCAHEFTEDAEHLKSHLMRFQGGPDDLERLGRCIGVVGEDIEKRIVIPLETAAKEGQLESVVRNLATISTLGDRIPASMIAEAEVADFWNGADLWKVRLHDGREFWKIAANFFGTGEQTQSRYFRGLFWVLQEGMIARGYWNNVQGKE